MHSGVYVYLRNMSEPKKRNAAAVALGRKGGKMSRVNLSAERRTELARKAAAARWKRDPKIEAREYLGSPSIGASQDVYLLAVRARFPGFWKKLYRIFREGTDQGKFEALLQQYRV